MKRILLTSLVVISTGIFISANGQNKEVPTKNKPAVRPQTGGAEGGDGSMSGRNKSNGGGNSGNGTVYRPVYRPRVIYQQPPIFFPSGNPVSNPGSTVTTDADNTDWRAARKRAEAEVEVKKVLFELKAPLQAFDIKDVTKPFEIVGEKGFKVSFPELAFVDEEGNPVLGEVEIQMTEYTENSEFAEAGLTTQTTDGQLLETGGMINLEAKSGDKKVFLGKGKSVQIEVPDMKNTDGFQTFYGEGNDVTTWSLTPPQNQSNENTEEFDGYTIRMAKTTQVIEGKTVSLVLFKGWKPLEDYLNENLKVPADVRSKILTDGIPFLYTIEVNALGRIKEVKPKYPEYSKNSLIADIQGKIKSILLDAPALTVSEGNLETGRKYDILFTTSKNTTKTVTFASPVNGSLNQGNSEKPSSAEVNRNPDSKTVDAFVMESSGLDKINCDRFSGKKSSDTQTFHFDRAAAKVYIVFKDQRSFIQPSGANGDYRMTGVPTGSAVKYVAVVYGDDGTVKMGVTEGESKSGPVEFAEYGDFTAEGLKAALRP